MPKSFRPTAISLFAGAGGCSLGFQQAGFDIRYAADIDADAVESYRCNFAATPCEAADIRKLDAETILKRIGLEHGELDIMLGGPPCQGFSSAGVKSGMTREIFCCAIMSGCLKAFVQNGLSWKMLKDF